MATTFVEQATLRVVDQSSTKIRAINNELRKLFATAKNGGSISIKVSGLQKARTDLQALNRLLGSIAAKKSVAVGVTTPGARQAANAVAELNKQLANLKQRRTTTVAVNYKQTGAPGANAPASGSRMNSVSLNTGNLSSILNNSWSRLGYTIETAIIQGFAKATIQRDISAASLDLLNLSPEQAAQANASARQIDREFPQFNEGQVRGTLAEVLRTTRFDQAAADVLVRQALSLAQLQILQGEDSNRAVDSAFEFVKAAEQSGNITDDQGNFSEEAANLFFDNIKKNIVGGGREITAELVRTLVKSLRVARFGLNERGFSTALALAEEQGSTAGVGLNQAIKQLSGQGQAKFRIARLAELGLLTTEEVQTGEIAGQPVFETRANQPLLNELLRADPAAWVREVLVPRLQATGLDVDDASAVSKAVNDIVGDRTAVESVTALILRREELRKQGDLVAGLNVSNDFVSQVAGSSTSDALASAEGGLTNLFGAIAESFESILIPALNKVGSAADAIASFISSDGTGSPLRTGALALGAVATGAIAFKGSQAALGALNPFSGASAALTGSASNLNAAAVALQRAAHAQSFGGGNNGPRKNAGLLGAAGALAVQAANRIIPPAAIIAPTALGNGEITPESYDALMSQAAAQGAPGVDFSKQLPENLSLSFEQGSANMLETFQTGTESIQTGVDESAAMFGPVAGQGMLPFAEEFGAIAGAAAGAAIANATKQATSNLRGRNSPRSRNLNTGQNIAQ